MTHSNHDGVAVLLIDNPPVNALGPQAVAPVLAALEAAQADDAVTALVLAGANGTFSGGADMKGFGISPPPRPNARDLIDALEASAKPVVAAVDGVAMGGGLEVALACDYRVAAPAARLGLPEITRGLLPGAGGTQRLPRLIGVRAALEMILGGEPAGAERAREIGLVDAVEADPRAGAVALARTLGGKPRRKISATAAQPDGAVLAAARERAQPEARGGLAEQHAIACVADAVELPFAEGLARERERFVELLGSEQSKARIHVFFAEREAAKLADGTAPPPFAVASAAVIGGGTMGTGIAMACANAGVRVTLIDVKPELLERARGIIAGNYAATVRKGKLAQAEMDARMQRIAFATSLDAAADADLVIEAVFEEMNVKQDVFRALDGIARRGAILATNTSTLDVDAIAGVTNRPEDVVGMHFFSPANVMKLLEIVRGARSAPQTIARALAIAKQLKKVGVVAGNCDGFIGNRMLHGYLREAQFLLEEGASPQQVDRVIRDFGLPMGPFQMGDLAGLDVGWRIRKGKHAIAPPAGRYSKVSDELCELGRYGQKTGAGYYRYEAGNRTPVADPFVDELIERVAREAGIARRTVSDDEILERCMYPLVNEAAKILAERIAARPGDVDVVWVYGYGFPAWRGGPLRWADSVGLAAILDKLRAYERVHGESWAPAPLLRELAERGGTFGAWRAPRAGTPPDPSGTTDETKEAVRA
ncbi:MAG TPA: 3-hydroxyacyl-CoA dehydrogenase NAD-binding domain-containing protein [Candidatus Elarobacter sp.]|nr:3-hydroxyacyl-CoA dehydrogenase NAD-binding domain-containing protein [Candidatus Elarobacter sp.]